MLKDVKIIIIVIIIIIIIIIIISIYKEATNGYKLIVIFMAVRIGYISERGRSEIYATLQRQVIREKRVVYKITAYDLTIRI